MTYEDALAEAFPAVDAGIQCAGKKTQRKQRERNLCYLCCGSLFLFSFFSKLMEMRHV